MTSSRILFVVLFLCAAVTNGCKRDEPKSTRWEDAAAVVAQSSPADGDATAAVPLSPAGTLNKFFPKDGEGGYKRVFAADKEGYAEAKLQKDGKEVAVLSISDAERLASAKAKFEGATEKLEGFPLMTVGKNQSTVLVKNRYQVKVSSQTLEHEARKAILATFDLKGLGT
jgi:hypothetical protein